VARFRCIVVQNNVNWLQASAPVLVTTSAPRSWVSKENPTDTANGLGSTNLNEQLEEHYTHKDGKIALTRWGKKRCTKKENIK
jgi:hypothetical protein